MPFDLTLSFTGIAAFVQLTEEPICVVMPGLDGPKDALDGEALCPHTSYLDQPDDEDERDCNNAAGVDFKRTPLKGQIVTFDLTPDGGDCYSGLPPQVMDMRLLLDDLCVINGDIVEKTSPPRPAFVMTQVFLPAGDFDSAKEKGWRVKHLPGHGASLAGPLIHDLYLTVRNLTRASAILTAMDGSGRSCVSLTPDDGCSPVAIQLVNTCKELSYPYEEAIRDRDFKWYYELLDRQAQRDITGLIGNDDLPIPRHRSSYSPAVVGGSGSHDCFPAQISPYISSRQASDRRSGKGTRRGRA